MRCVDSSFLSSLSFIPLFRLQEKSSPFPDDLVVETLQNPYRVPPELGNPYYIKDTFCYS